MYTKQEIILRNHRDGLSQRRISKDLCISRKTVSKYVEEYNNLLKTGKKSSEALRICLTRPPIYNSTKREKKRLTEEIQSAIDLLLEENQKKRMSGMSKQQLKKVDILAILHQQGFNIGYTTVCNYIRSKKNSGRPREAFIRQQYAPGSNCEFDWGEVKLEISGQMRKFQMAVFTSGYSNYRYAFLYERQDTLAFMESHVRFYSFTGGVFSEMVYDNMRVAVSKFIGKHEKEPTQALLDLRSHYGFSHRFCNTYKGNEKGHVERSVEYVRRKAFGLKHNFETLEEANKYLLLTIEKINTTKQQLKGKSANELFAEEKQYLMKQSEALAFCDSQQLRVDKYATVCYRTNRYSVSDKLVGKFVDVKIYSSKLKIFHNNELVSSHPRAYSKHKWYISIEHYLDTFKQKPRAICRSVALASRCQLKKIYDAYFTDYPRDFIDLLHYCHKYQIKDDSLTSTVEKLTTSGKGIITSEKLIALLGNKASQVSSAPKELDQTNHLAIKQLNQIAKIMA